MNLENMKAQMRKGILEMCILSILSHREAYPSDIIEQLRQQDLIVVEGTLYPLLSRLKNAGLLSYQWRESTSGPPRKYFHITDSGTRFLSELNQTWTELVNAVSNTTQNSTTR